MNRKVYLVKKMLYTVTGKREKLMQLNIKRLRNSGMTIGKNLRLFSKISTPEPYLVEIGDDVTISSQVTILTHDNAISKFIEDKSDTFGKVKIGNNCFIGARVMIMPGVTLGDNTVVGAGSVVTKSFEGNVVIGGYTAKVLSGVDEWVERTDKIAFNVDGLTPSQKRKLILDNPDKIISK